LIVAEVGRAIGRLKDEGQSIVLVEQNRQLALGVADQAVILNTGRCVFAGSAADVANNEELSPAPRRFPRSLAAHTMSNPIPSNDATIAFTVNDRDVEIHAPEEPRC